MGACRYSRKGSSFRITLWLVLLLGAGGLAWGDRVFLKGGTVLVGKVVAETETEVSLDLEGGGSMTLPHDLVQNIEIIVVPTPIPPTETPTPVEIRVILPSATPSPTAILAHAVSQETEPASDELGAATPQAAGATVKLATRTAPVFSEAQIQQLGQGRRMFGKTKDTVGVVEVKRPGKDWQEMPEETVLFEGDQLRTLNGRSKITVEEPEHQTEVRIKEESEVEVPQAEKTSTIELRKGKIWSRIRSLSAADEIKFRIRTPNAVAGVRGTLLYVELLPQESKVAVFEGEVQVQGREHLERSESVTRLKALTISTEERFSSLFNVDPGELKEWEEWDEWARRTKAELVPYGNAVGLGGLIGAQVDQIAAEGKLYAAMAAEGNRAVVIRRQGEQLDSVKESILRYYRDVQHLPAPDYGLTYLQSNIESSPQWRGPYLDSKYSLPVKDVWGTEIKYEIRTSAQSGRTYAVLISAGPDRRFSDGKGDDVMVLVVPPEP